MRELCDTGATKFRKVVYPSILVALFLWFEAAGFEKLLVAGELRLSLFFGPLIVGGFFSWAWWQNERPLADSVLDAGDRLVIKRGGITQTVELAGVEVGTERMTYTNPGGGSAALVALHFSAANDLGEAIMFFPESSAAAVATQIEMRARLLRESASSPLATADVNRSNRIEPGEWRLDMPPDDPLHGGP